MGGDRLNLTAYFLDRAVEEGRGDRIALYGEGGATTYAQLLRLTNRIGHVLRALSIRPGERVILALRDGPEFVAAWYAVPKVGAVVAEVYTFLQPKEYAYYLRYSGAAAVVVDASTRERVFAVAGDCPALRHILVVGEADGLRPREHSLQALLAGADDELAPAPTGAEDPALWKFTTGSTGAPKAAVHRHRDPVAAFRHYALGVLGLRAGDVVLPVPKLFFGYARDLTALFPFGVGAAGVVFPDRSTPERVFELIARHRPTILVNVPTMINEMNQHPAGADLSSLRLCISSGEALPAEVHRRWRERFGVEILEGIGSSELYHIYISNRPGAVRPGSAGELVGGYRALIVDREGRPLPDGEVGELWVSGESAATHYWDDPEKSARTFAGEWVHTGDLFSRDRDGYFWYRGRADDLLKVGGIWVAPMEIEACLLQHPAVAECAVVGATRQGLTLLRAFVVLREPAAGETLAGELQAFVRARLSPHKVPREVRVLPALPKTATGKVDRRTLREAG